MAYEAVCEGEYVAKDGRDVDICFFTETFVLDDAVKTQEQARAIIQSGLLSERLRRTVKNYKRWRTCQIVSFEKTKEKAEHSELDEALLTATTLGCVPENIDNYKRPDFKLKALQKAIESHKSRVKKVKPDQMQEVEIEEE